MAQPAEGGSNGTNGNAECAEPVVPASQTQALPSAEPRSHSNRRMVVAGSLAAAAICALVVWQLARSGREEPPLSFGATDWVLVTAFENHTGEPVFTGTLEYVLRQQLSASSFVRVASPDRVRDALALMRRPLDTPVDVPIGREISQRDGAIRVLVAGRIDKLSDRYALSVELLSTVDGRSVAVDRRTVDRRDEVLEAIAAQAEWVRRTLGERKHELSAPRHLEPAWARLRLSGQERTCLVAERLAFGYLQSGRSDRALEVATVPMRPLVYDFLGASARDVLDSGTSRARPAVSCVGPRGPGGRS